MNKKDKIKSAKLIQICAKVEIKKLYFYCRKDMKNNIFIFKYSNEISFYYLVLSCWTFKIKYCEIKLFKIEIKRQKKATFKVAFYIRSSCVENYKVLVEPEVNHPQTHFQNLVLKTNVRYAWSE